MDAVLELERAGYHFTIDGDTIRYALAPDRQVDPDAVQPLLEQLREHKREALAFLRQRETPAALYQAAAAALARAWQPGTGAWLEQHRPELAREIDQAEAATCRAWLAAEDGTAALGGFKEALGRWRKANLQAIRAYTDSKLLTLAGADPAEVARAKEQLRTRGYFLMHSHALGERIAVIEHDRQRRNVPRGIPAYTLAEIWLLQQGVEAGSIVTIGDLRALHESKKQLGGQIVRWQGSGPRCPESDLIETGIMILFNSKLKLKLKSPISALPSYFHFSPNPHFSRSAKSSS